MILEAAEGVIPLGGALVVPGGGGRGAGAGLGLAGVGGGGGSSGREVALDYVAHLF